MLPSPYGDCLDAEDYTFTGCMGQCVGKFSVTTCGCRLAMWEGINLGNNLFAIIFYLCVFASVFVYYLGLGQFVLWLSRNYR